MPLFENLLAQSGTKLSHSSYVDGRLNGITSQVWSTDDGYDALWCGEIKRRLAVATREEERTATELTLTIEPTPALFIPGITVFIPKN